MLNTAPTSRTARSTPERVSTVLSLTCTGRLDRARRSGVIGSEGEVAMRGRKVIDLCGDISELSRASLDVQTFRRHLLDLLLGALPYDCGAVMQGPEWVADPRRPEPESCPFTLTIRDWLAPLVIASRVHEYTREVWELGGPEAYFAPTRGWCEMVQLFESTGLRGSHIHEDYINAFRLSFAPMRHWTEGTRVFALTLGRRRAVRDPDRETAVLDLLFPLIRVGNLLNLANAGRPHPPTDLGLPRRQAEIAGLVARGLRNAEIATLLGVSPLTVRNQLTAIFARLGVTTRAELAGLVTEAGGRSSLD
jgi:DNA-binding CsgD family transcriptional regulator